MPDRARLLAEAVLIAVLSILAQRYDECQSLRIGLWICAALLAMVLLVDLVRTQRRRSATPTEAVEQFDAEALADQLRAVNDEMKSTVIERYNGIPNRPEPSHERVHFGPKDYERETLRRYIERHSAQVATLIDKAERRGYASLADKRLAGRVRNLDEFWVLSTRIIKVIGRLRDDERSRRRSTINLMPRSTWDTTSYKT